MKNAQLDANNNLLIQASAGSCASDFDFLLGVHKVMHRKLKVRLAQCEEWDQFTGTHFMQSLLKGSANLEQHVIPFADDILEGMALRLFDPVTRLWSIHWADSKRLNLDVPMVGSFENNVGHFYAKDTHEGKPVLVQFKWDATNPVEYIWSQAFSEDNGLNWEWNWFMHFTKDSSKPIAYAERSNHTADQIPLGVIELRHYIMKHGARDRFINYFEENFIESQKALKGYVIGQYRVKGSADNFCWIRGFRNMKERSAFLPAFYYGDEWKKHKAVANGMLANNDNVYLLQPLTLSGDSFITGKPIPHTSLVPTKGIAVIHFYIANSKLDQLLPVFAKEYIPLLKKAGINETTFWTSMMEENDFPRLPVFQDKNLLVTISFYDNELDYEEKEKAVEMSMNEDLKSRLQDIITIKNTVILYPTDKTLQQKP